MGYQRIEWFLNIGWPCCSLCRKPHRGWGLWCSQTVGIVRRVAGFRGWLAPVGWPSTDNRWWRRNCGGPGRSLVNKGWPRLCYMDGPFGPFGRSWCPTRPRHVREPRPAPRRQLLQSWADFMERLPGVAGAALWQPQAMGEIPFRDCAAGGWFAKRRGIFSLHDRPEAYPTDRGDKPPGLSVKQFQSTK